MTDLVLLKEKTLLFAEDDLVIQQKMSEIFRALFKKVFVASNGQEALEKYVDNKPDIVLTDIQMPEMDGLKLIEEIRYHDLDTLIIVFSSHNDQKYLLKAVNLDISGYIFKPAMLENVFEVFSKCAKKLSRSSLSIVKLDKNLVYHKDTHEIIKNGETIQLPAKEYKVIEELTKHYPKIVTKENMRLNVWNDEDVSESAMKNMIQKLRKKIGSEYIVAISGIGWRLQLGYDL